MLRSVDSYTTVISFQHIIRMVSLSVRLNTVIRGSNVDSAEKFDILVTMSHCLKKAAKECDVEAEDLKATLEDELLKELTIRYVDDLREPEKKDGVKDVLLFKLCGYMMHARPALLDCIDCCNSVCCEQSQLPKNFDPSCYNKLVNRGKLMFVSQNFFRTFRVIESVVEKHLQNIFQIHMADSFEKCISEVAKSNVIPVFCDAHRDHHLPYLIGEYVVVRYHFESKRLKEKLLSKSATQVKKNFKLSKLA